MNNEDFLEDYQKQMLAEEQAMLEEYSELIDFFISYCEEKGIRLTIKNFRYIQTIGVLVEYPDIVRLLDDNIETDKDDLIDFKLLTNSYETKQFVSGYLYADRYMLMAHPYFRRGHHVINNYAPRFIDLFWTYNLDWNEKYLAIDFDRVRINVDDSCYLEADTWFGARFQEEISLIEDGTVKLRPPLDLEPRYIDFIFGGVYSLDIKWQTAGNIKTFYLEEFKEDTVKIVKGKHEYYPARYIHAEYDLENNAFQHFDGAIHFYDEEEYLIRRDTDLNHNDKNNTHIKGLSQKLFKINGKVDVRDWIELTCHFLHRNFLIFEYFEGKLPEMVIEKIERIRAIQSKKH